MIDKDALKELAPANSVIVEYGGGSDFVTGCVRDSEGNQMLCKCGKPGNFIAGKESFKIRCPDCGWA
jgi:hypothetical protein